MSYTLARIRELTEAFINEPSHLDKLEHVEPSHLYAQIWDDDFDHFDDDFQVMLCLWKAYRNGYENAIQLHWSKIK